MSAKRARKQLKRRKRLAKLSRPPTCETRRYRDLDRRLDAIIGQTFRAPLPRVLYHYTSSIDAVRGILTTGAIWATDHRHTNDDAELLSADEAVRSVLAAARGAASREAARVLGFVERRLSSEHISNKTEVYLACFSLAADLASQWNDYAAGGRGFRLGFKVFESNARGDNDFEVLLMPVEYGREALEARLQRAVGSILKAVIPFVRHDQLEDQAGVMASAALLRVAAAAALQTKGESWASEVEWRRIAVPRVRKTHGHRIEPSPRPHVSLELNPGGQPVVESIMIGPAHPDPEGVHAEIRELMAHLGYPVDVPVVRSTAVVADDGSSTLVPREWVSTNLQT